MSRRRSQKTSITYDIDSLYLPCFMQSIKDVDERDTVVEADAKVKALLRRLHAANAVQESSYQRLWYQFAFSLHCVRNWSSRDAWNQYHDLYNTDQLLSHSREKCELIYMLACLNNTKCAVECGTSYGVSSIYLALAIHKNTQGHKQDAVGVLTMEKDAVKSARARQIWTEAGKEVENLITLHEGDLLQTLADVALLPEVVDLLFLDAWTSLALPALRLVLPRLRPGSLIFADKTHSAKLLYQDFLDFIQNRANGFMSITVPFVEGLEVIIYQPKTLN